MVWDFCDQNWLACTFWILEDCTESEMTCLIELGQGTPAKASRVQPRVM